MKTTHSVLASAISSACLFSVFSSTDLAAKTAHHTSCVAHRGYSAKHLENSVEAILAADAVKVPGIEFDVVHSQDGVAIVHHDKTPKRTARSKKGRACALETPFSEQSFAQIRENCELQNGEEIPSLEEVFSATGHSTAKLFVELKDTPSPQTLDLLRHHNKNKVVISFSANDLDLVSEAQVKAPIIFLADEYSPLPERFDGLGTAFLSEEQIMDLQGRGKLTNIWTVNDRPTIRQLLVQGIDFITTDQVELCMEEVERSKLEPAP
ncbi:MAG: hypothetical protein HRU09_15410 [Oligoflexales bacterium]|nr:hypothetical protein [Oligoflexales bacterium]